MGNLQNLDIMQERLFDGGETIKAYSLLIHRARNGKKIELVDGTYITLITKLINKSCDALADQQTLNPEFHEGKTAQDIALLCLGVIVLETPVIIERTLSEEAVSNYKNAEEYALIMAHGAINGSEAASNLLKTFQQLAISPRNNE